MTSIQMTTYFFSSFKHNTQAWNNQENKQNPTEFIACDVSVRKALLLPNPPASPSVYLTNR